MPEMRIIEGFLGAGAILRSNRKENLMANSCVGELLSEDGPTESDSVH